MQMAAEELDMPIEQTRLVEGDTDLCPDQGPTWASLSVQVAGAQSRQAAATARRVRLDFGSIEALTRRWPSSRTQGKTTDRIAALQ
jgi:CO/xanthine dehydrogenase Mo-binding subunit